MLLRCVANEIESITDTAVREQVAERVRISGPIECLHIGALYVVQAIQNTGPMCLFYIELQSDDSYPTPWPATLFEIVDYTVATNWVTAKTSDFSLTTFPEWANDASFYERLVNGDEAWRYQINRAVRAQQSIQADAASPRRLT